MQNELAKIEATHRTFLIGRREIHIAESSDLERRETSLRIADFAHAGVLFSR
jgi:hypothetical protein